MIKKTILAIAAIASAIGTTQAELYYGMGASYAGIYLCTLEKGGGLEYKPIVESWQPSTFRTDEKFIYDLRLIEEVRVEKYPGQPSFMHDLIGHYTVTMKYAGTDMSEECGTVENPARIADNAVLTCPSYLADYKINFGNLKFVSLRYNDYLDMNDDEELKQAAVLAGHCTKID